MWDPIIRWSMLLTHVLLASALISPLSIPNAESLLAPKANISAPPIAAVSTIPGLEVRLQFNVKDQPLDKLSVYANSIEMMYRMAQQPWSDTMNLRHITPMVKIGYKVVILTRLSGSGKLETRHAIMALYKGILAMASEQPGYYQLNAAINLEHQLIGSIQINRLGVDLDPVNVVAGSTPSGNPTLNTTTSQIIDPTDPNTFIRYTLGKQTFASQEILTVVLDGLVNAAQYAGGSLKAVTGRSVSGDTELFLSGVLGQDVLASDVTRALYLVSMELVIPFSMYNQLSFDLYKSGKWIAAGSITSSGSKSSTGGDVVANS